MGLLMDVSEYSGRCEVQLIREGDGNFTGDEKEGTLRRIHSLSEVIIFNHKHPVGWHGVDEEVRATILESKQLYEQAKHPNLEKGKDGEHEQKDVCGQEATQEVAGETGRGSGQQIEEANGRPEHAVSLTKFDEESEVEEG